jgi:hypothetical protein
MKGQDTLWGKPRNLLTKPLQDPPVTRLEDACERHLRGEGLLLGTKFALYRTKIPSFDMLKFFIATDFAIASSK